MGKRKKTNRVLVSCVFLLLTTSIFSETWGDLLIKEGIGTFGQAKYDESIRIFREIIVDTGLTENHGDAYFWIAKAYMALGQYDSAGKNLEFFIEEFPENYYFPESLYQKGRLLFLQKDYEACILALHDFINSYPLTPYIANSYFWIGESLYSLGQFSEALQMFTTVVEQFPASFKVEGAQYRISLIELKEREQELLKLLKWSHEEYLKMLEDFQRRERSYEQALASYQRRIAEITSQDKDKQIASLTAEVDKLKRSVSAHESEISALKAQLESATTSNGGTSSSTTEETGDSAAALDELKKQLQDLQSYYSEKLESSAE